MFIFHFTLHKRSLIIIKIKKVDAVRCPPKIVPGTRPVDTAQAVSMLFKSVLRSADEVCNRTISRAIQPVNILTCIQEVLNS